MVKALIPLADYGNDPTEVATPWQVFSNAGFEVSFATEQGTPAACDKKMYSGITQKLLGAGRPPVEQHAAMQKDIAYQKPLAWSSPDFSMKDYDLVFLPGGHEKGMRQYIESKTLHRHLAQYVPLTAQSDDTSNKCLAAICHGVQVLSTAGSGEDPQKSIIHDFETTALPGRMEQGIYYATALFLGSYYKTYGAGSPSVEDLVKGRLDDPEKQYKNSLSMSPFVHEDPKHRYISGRFPPDAQLLAERVVEMVSKAHAKA